jgi:carboxymethylenebutenolidase
MQGKQIEMRTAAGVARAYEVRGEGDAPLPGVLMLMDGMGFRPALFGMADRFAAAGYHVLLPDLFHRIGPDVQFDPNEVFGSPDKLAAMRKVLSALVPAEMIEDIGAALDVLVTRRGVDAARIGVHGYCMGGRYAYMTATQFPDRVRAAAAIHGGGFVTPAPDSPHLSAPNVKARLYFGIAKDDHGFTAEHERVLREALTSAGVRFEMDHYEARHGWAVPGSPVFDAAEAERHYARVLDLYAAELR